MANFKFQNYHVPSHVSKIHQSQQLAQVNCSHPGGPFPFSKPGRTALKHAGAPVLSIQTVDSGRLLRSPCAEVMEGKKKRTFF